jgi:hypothetical protein
MKLLPDWLFLAGMALCIAGTVIRMVMRGG